MIGLCFYGGNIFRCYFDGCSALFLWGEMGELYYGKDESYLLVIIMVDRCRSMILVPPDTASRYLRISLRTSYHVLTSHFRIVHEQYQVATLCLLRKETFH